MKWGSKYGPEYVNRLYNQCKDYIRTPFRFYCATDNSNGIYNDVTPLNLSKYCIPEGKWGGNIFTAEKVRLLTDSLFTEKTILFDLDVLILSDLTQYINDTDVSKKPLWIFNYWNDKEKFKKNYGKITCTINSSFIVSTRESMIPLYNRLFSEYYDYYSLKFNSLDRTVNYIATDLINYHDKKIVYSYNFGASYPNDIKPGIKRKDYKLCLFNNSHGTGVDLHEVEGWAKKYWKSYD